MWWNWTQEEYDNYVGCKTFERGTRYGVKHGGLLNEEHRKAILNLPTKWERICYIRWMFGRSYNWAIKWLKI